MLVPLLQSGIKGIDRIMPIEKTMGFTLVWGSDDLIGMLSRIVSME